MRTITLKIDNAGAWYSATGCIPWTATNLAGADFRFSERAAIFWEVEMLAYGKHTARLRVQCVDFEAGEENYDPYRKMRSPVRHLEFAPLEEAPDRKSVV